MVFENVFLILKVFGHGADFEALYTWKRSKGAQVRFEFEREIFMKSLLLLDIEYAMSIGYLNKESRTTLCLKITIKNIN